MLYYKDTSPKGEVYFPINIDVRLSGDTDIYNYESKSKTL